MFLSTFNSLISTALCVRFFARKNLTHTCIGNGNSGENPNRFNMKRARKRDNISTQSYLALGFLCKAKRLRKLL